MSKTLRRHTIYRSVIGKYIGFNKVNNQKRICHLFVHTANLEKFN